MRKLTLLLSGLLLGWTLACGGGSSNPTSPAVPAKGLVYTDPTGNGWRLIKDSSSTATRIVLNLVGPAGLKSRGVGFNLQAPAGVRFGKFVTADPVTTGLPIKDSGVYYLLDPDPWGDGSVPPGLDPLEPKLLAGGVKKGNLLTVGIFQKARWEPAKDSGSALCQIALEFDPTANLSVGDKLDLSIPKSKYTPEDIGTLIPGTPGVSNYNRTPTEEMSTKSHLVDMPIAVGSLSAN